MTTNTDTTSGGGGLGGKIKYVYFIVFILAYACQHARRGAAQVIHGKSPRHCG